MKEGVIQEGFCCNVRQPAETSNGAGFAVTDTISDLNTCEEQLFFACRRKNIAEALTLQKSCIRRYCEPKALYRSELCRAALLRNPLGDHIHLLAAPTHGACLMEANQNFVRGVLETGIRLMKLPGSLRGQLTELIAIRNVGECPIDQIGTHEESFHP
jgi:hypothetical protein